MKALEVTDKITEKRVESSWLYDISYSRKRKIVQMTVKNGVSSSTYYVKGVSRHMFDKWHRSASKGKFFHYNIKGFYNIEKVS